MKIHQILLGISLILFVTSTTLSQNPYVNDNGVLRSPANASDGPAVGNNSFYTVDVLAIVIPPKDGKNKAFAKAVKVFYQTMNNRSSVLITSDTSRSACSRDQLRGCSVPLAILPIPKSNVISSDPIHLGPYFFRGDEISIPFDLRFTKTNDDATKDVVQNLSDFASGYIPAIGLVRNALGDGYGNLLRAADNKLDPIHIGRGTAVFSSNKASTIALPFRVGTKLIQEYMPDRLNKQETVDAAIQDNYRLVRDIVVDRNNKAVDNASYIVFQITPLDVDAGLKRLVEGGLKSYKAHVDSIAKLSPGTSPIGQSVWYASMGSEIARDLKFILDADKQAGSAKAVEAFGIYLKRLAEIHKDTESGFKFQDATIDRLLSDINDESAGGLAFRSTEALPASKAEILTLYLDRIQRRIKANAISYSGVSYHSNYVNAVVLRDLTSTIDRAEIGKVNPALKAQLSGLLDVYITGIYEQSDGTKEVLLAGELANDLPTRLKQLMGNDWNVSGAVMKATLAGRYVLKTDATSLKLVRPADVIRDRVSETISSITDSDKLLLALRQGYEDIDNLLTTGVQDDPSTPGRLQQDARQELFKLIDAARKPFESTADFNAFVANKTLVKNGTKIAILEPKPEASSTTPAKP